MSTIWNCKIGTESKLELPDGADFPMRRAIEKAYWEITGEWPDFIFSGWGAELTKAEKECQRIMEENRKKLGT